jgi:flagellar hook-associated protein 3 FlgL
MISNLDASSELFLTNVSRIQGRIAEANRQISSGKKIGQPSDAPDQIDSLLQLRANLQHNTQIQSNLGLALTDAQAADQALGSAISLMDRARVLASQGANSTMDTAGRQSLAQETQSLLDEMVAYSQTTVQGRFIFSGDQDGGPAYQGSAASATGVVQLTTAAATRRIEDPAGGSFAASRTAQEIFDNRNADDTPAVDNVFAAVSGLKAALLRDDPLAVEQVSGTVQASSLHLNSMLAFYGNVQARVQDAASIGARYDTDMRKQLSNTEDADAAAAALELTQGNIQLQAAFQARAAMPHKTLFEYLG